MSVLAFGAHPDDVDLYAGGLVASLVARGERVHLVDLTAGELGTRGSVEQRAAEAATAAAALGVTRECLGLPDGALSAEDQAQLRAVVGALRAARPRLVLGPWPVDPHPDHAATHELVRKARFLARLAKWEAPGAPCRPGPILWYEQKVPFEPDLIVDVTAGWDAKARAVAAFGSQFQRGTGDDVRTEISDPEFHEMLRARARAHGQRIGVEWGEAYRREDLAAVRDPRLLLGEDVA